MVEDNKARRLTEITGEKAEIIRSVILNKTTPLNDFEYPDKFQGLTNTPEQTERAQYSVQYNSSKELLDSSINVHSNENKANWLKKARFKDGVQGIGLGRLVEWDEIPPPTEDSVNLAFRKEVEQQSMLFREANNYFSKMCG